MTSVPTPFPLSNSSTFQAFSRCFLKLFQHFTAVFCILLGTHGQSSTIQLNISAMKFIFIFYYYYFISLTVKALSGLFYFYI